VRKFLNKVAKFGATATASAAALVLGTSTATAAVPAEVATALSESTTDVGTVAGGVLLVILTIMTFKWIRRAL
jgi:hypothetical protein